MSFLIAVHVNEGIVLASDRRSTYTTTKTVGNTVTKYIGVHTTDSTDKTFLCPNGCGISACGDASLLGLPITGYIQDVIRTKIDEQCKANRGLSVFHQLPRVPQSISGLLMSPPIMLDSVRLCSREHWKEDSILKQEFLILFLHTSIFQSFLVPTR